MGGTAMRDRPRALTLHRASRLLALLAGTLLLAGILPGAVLAAAPTVTINQAAGQADPTTTSPINFTVVFSEAVTGFATGDVNYGGSTASETSVGTISGGPTTYNVAVTGMTTGGSGVASIP